MTEKERARQVLDELPETATTEDIVEAIRFRRAVEEGLEDLAAGRLVSHEEAKKRLAKWLTE